MKKLILTCLVAMISSQFIIAQKTVTGKVTDNTGMPLPGASVMIKNTNIGGITDFDGNYNLKINAEECTLVFFYYGMKNKEVFYNGQPIINVTLEEEISKLDEVVVIGYQEVQKRDVTGSISSVDDKTIEISKSPNLFDAIQGRVAGVNITSTSGELGAAVNFNIRGSNSVFSAGSPLFIIDGVQIDIEEREVASSGVGSVQQMDPLATINPLDIVSIEVLKDASATAIYGSRGSNGVIIVTTKGGQTGKLNFEYTGSISFSEAANRINIVSPEEYLDYRRRRDPGNPFTTLPDGTPRDFSNIQNFNWQDEILRTSITHNHFINASGGSEKTKYSASLGLLNQEGLVIENDYKKYNFRIKTTHKQSDRLNFEFNLNSSFTEVDGVANSGGGGDEFNGVVQFMVIANPWGVQDLTLDDEITQDFLNPLSLIYEGEKKMRLNRTIGSFSGEYEIAKKLKFKSQIGVNYSGSKLQEFHSSKSLFGWRWDGRALLRQTETSSYNFTNTLRYANTFKKKHHFNTLAGFEVAGYNFESFFLDIIDFENQFVGFNDIRAGQVFKDYGSERFLSNRMSFFYRANYTFKNKYLFTFNFRADGSDRLGLNNRWGYFPGGAFSWRANRENFLKDVKQINDLKFRLSYGATGNERIPPFSYAARLNNAFYASNDNLNFGLAPGSLENQDLKWETTTQFNAGIDLTIFKERVTIIFDFYNKLTRDMLIDTPIPGQSGFNSQWQNLGMIQNRGVEFSFSTVNISTPNFKWTTDFNINQNINKVKDLGNVQFIPTLIPGGWINNPGRVIVGQSIGVMYGYVFDGIHQIGNTDGGEPGRMRYKDLNGDGIIDDQNDRTIIGDSNPLHTGGFGNNFTYKNFNLSFFWQWSYGNDVFNEAILRTNGFQPFMNITRDYYVNAWTPENASNTAPAFGRIEPVASSYFVEDASFLRLKTVNFSYDIPNEKFKNNQISSVRLFVSANNLLTFTNYSGFDPEVASRNPLLRGFERFSYPRSRSVIFGLTAKF
ncbi:MAG: SusC/RagA family TonB-linked outer membrane protein [Flavobacterium sp.]